MNTSGRARRRRDAAMFTVTRRSSSAAVAIGATGMTRVCAFSVATALAWIGHDFRGTCPAETTTQPASVWFVRTPGVNAPRWVTTLVVIDFSPRDRSAAPAQSPAPVRAMLRRVNDCTQSEHIRVRERVSGDHGRGATL